MNQSNDRPPAPNSSAPDRTSRSSSSSGSTGADPTLSPGFAKKLIPSDALLEGEREVWIQHGSTIYRLCETKTGKLILQK